MAVFKTDFNAGIAPLFNNYDPDIWEYCKISLTKDDCDHLKKRGRSPISLAYVRESILKYGEGVVDLPPDDEIFDQVYYFVWKQWNQYRVKPLSFEQTAEYITSSSSGGFLSAGYKKGECFKTACRRAKISYDNVINGRRNVDWPCMVATRPGMVDRGDVKARGVWVYPYYMTIRECRYAEPIINAINSHSSFMGWTIKWTDGAANMLEAIFFDPPKTSFGADYSGFDYHQHVRRIKQSFAILHDMIDTRDYSTKEKRDFERDWKDIVRYFIRTPMLCGNRIYVKRCGTPSGSYFTQLVDSVYNMLALCDAIVRTNVEMYSGPILVSAIIDKMFILGDDSIVKLKTRWASNAKEKIIDYLLQFHNLVWHPHKGFWCTGNNPEDLEFLGHHFCGGSGPTRPMITFVEHALYPEKVHDSPGVKKAAIVGLIWMTSPCQSDTLRWLRGLLSYLDDLYPDDPIGDYPLWMLRQFKFALMRVPDVQPPDDELLRELYQHRDCYYAHDSIRWFDDVKQVYVYW